MKALLIALLAVTTTGCSMTPEQRMRWSQALTNTGNYMMHQQQMADRQAQQPRQIQPAYCYHDFQNRLVCQGAR